MLGRGESKYEACDLRRRRTDSVQLGGLLQPGKRLVGRRYVECLAPRRLIPSASPCRIAASRPRGWPAVNSSKAAISFLSSLAPITSAASDRNASTPIDDVALGRKPVKRQRAVAGGAQHSRPDVRILPVLAEDGAQGPVAPAQEPLRA